MNHCWLSVWTNLPMSISVCVSRVEDILPKCMRFVRPLPKPSSHITRNTWTNKARMSWKRRWLHMIGLFWLRIQDVQNQRSLVVQERERGIKNRIVRVTMVLWMYHVGGCFPDWRVSIIFLCGNSLVSGMESFRIFLVFFAADHFAWKWSRWSLSHRYCFFASILSSL